jgi:hypothetical protein
MKILMIGFVGFIVTRGYRRDQSSLVTIIKYQKNGLVGPEATYVVYFGIAASPALV